jgi:hypothetical protein
MTSAQPSARRQRSMCTIHVETPGTLTVDAAAANG